MADDGKETRRGFRVTGRVQGVGFRWWTQRTAEGLGLAGSVRNLADGAVEVHVVGAEPIVARLEEALREGPAGSHVERVEPIPPDPSAPRSGFVIAR